MPELNDETLRLITENEIETQNLNIDNTGYACPGPILAPWAKDMGESIKGLQHKALVLAMQGQLDIAAIDIVLYDYLVIAFRAGWECGRQRLEVPICRENHGE